MALIDEIFGNGKKPLPRVNGVLTFIFRKLVTDMNLNKAKWSQLIHKYIVRPNSGIESTPTARSSAKRNKTKALGGSNITWKTFIEGIKIINPKSAFFYIKVTRDDGEVFESDLELTDNTALGKYFREFVYNMEITIDAWDQNMRQYINDPTTNLPNNPKKRSTHRGNLDKALSNRSLTWNTFQRGLLAHRVVKFEYELWVTWPSGKTTVHDLKIDK